MLNPNEIHMNEYKMNRVKVLLAVALDYNFIVDQLIILYFKSSSTANLVPIIFLYELKVTKIQ